MNKKEKLFKEWCRDVYDNEGSFEKFVYYTALKRVTEALDRLIGASMDDLGKPKAPEMRVLMESRGFIPKGYSTSYPEKRAKCKVSPQNPEIRSEGI